MSFNIFDFPRKSDITVGYVDPTLGYVTGVSICDANEYAKKNPGTTFVFETRDGIRYLNINEVNQLTPKDLPSSADTCTGIIVEGRAESPSVTFSGCGGVGAAGNPVFGRDGSLLGVDLISGGFGYQCPPLVEVRDETGLGVGAVIRSILVGDPEYPDCTFVDTFEVFDQEDDFEDYQICDPVDDVGYGTRYDPDGKPIGRWEPTLYATLSRDPIAREIQRYQDFLQQLSTPWWTTRKENPLRVTSGNRTTRIKHDVQHPGWGGEYGIERGEDFKEVTFNVFVSGGQDKGLALKFTSEDKSHTFKIKADDFKNNETGQKVTERVKINTIYNVSSEGSFQGKGTEKGIINALGRGAREKNPTGKEVVINGSTIFADFLESSNDNDDLQVEATLGKFTSKQIGKGSSRSNFDLKYELKDNASYTKPAKIDDSFMNKYAISPVPPSSAPGSDFAGQEFTMEWEENFPYDGEYVFRAQADNIGRYYLDNEKLIETTQFKSDQTPKVVKKNVKAGVHRIRLDLFNIPIKEKVVKQVITQPPTPDQKPFKITAAYTGVKNLVNNFKAGIYKVKVAYRQDTGPSGIAIEIKNKSNGNVVFDSLRSINGSNVKLIPVTSGKYALNEFSKNSAESQIFLQRSGVFPENIKDNSTTNIEWSNVYINESGDYEISASADDQMVLEVLIANALPVEVNTQQSKTSTSSQNTQSRKVFNTVDYISKADRQLWRLDPRAGRDAGFINQYGVLPFDPNSDRAQSDDFSGTHVIRWEYVDFPVDGNYNIEIMVDDNVTLYIGNRDGGGAKEIGNGLRPIDQGGDEVIITKRGFSSPGRSTGKSLETRFFKAGKYRIRAELEQINVGPLAKGNPMALAVNIETSFTEEEVISAKSWNENPMGGALTIDAPIPPIPQEPIPPQEGRCPNNPIWTTRFPGAKEKWWPVKFQNAPGLPSWSRFMNRYAISPIPPLAKPGSDGGGIVYRNQWDIDIPYDGFYAFKSTVDNAGRILIDGKPIMQANYIPTTLENTRGGSGSERRSGIAAIGSDGIIFNWRENNPKSKKIFLSKGLHKIEIEVENGKTNTFQKIDKKVFSTKDWLFPSKPTQTTQSITTDTTTEIISTSKTSPGVVYEGPTPIVNYRGDFISPVLQNVNAFPNEEVQGKTWIFRWTNVDFPVDGQYTLESEADDQLIVRIDGNEVGVSKVFEGRRKINFNATKGKRTVELELSNIRIPDTGFEQNPVVGFAQITVPVDVATGVGQPWITNPIGISAILIPPPCPKKVTGKGVVCRVVVDDPGNGYPITRGPGYPAALRLRSVEVENTGINYNCGVDQIQITPSNGAQLGYECDTFGRITRVNVLNPGLGFTEYPEISIVSPPGVEPTGVNATFRPQFEIVRDPIVVDPDIIIQVTDLVGLKQTGYVDGRPYYGAVYYKDGVRYAGFYQTPGELVQVYDTLQESIDGVVVTRPSAIQRQGTDISSNDPRLNIPGTPNEII
jgi:hypothetical protein